jgi:hypothetical protein
MLTCVLSHGAHVTIFSTNIFVFFMKELKKLAFGSEARKNDKSTEEVTTSVENEEEDVSDQIKSKEYDE